MPASPARATPALLALLALAAPALAVGTRSFELTRIDDLKGGSLDGVAVDSAGNVRAGLTLGKVEVPDATFVWSLLARKDGSVLLGSGNDGRIHVFDGTAVKPFAETGALVVTSLVEGPGGDVFAATLPDGEIFKVTSGKAAKFVKLPGAEHVFQLAYDARSGALFAATGPEGKLFRVDARGNAQVYFDASEQHLVSVAVAPDGVVYAGAGDKAKLYQVSGPGRATVLHDFGRTEVRAIAVSAAGDVYAVANELKSGAFTAPKRGGAAGPAQRPAKTTGKGTLCRFDAGGRPEQLIDDKDEAFTALALGDDGQPYVGTASEGRVYTVDARHAVSLVADVEERQIGALLLQGQRRVVAASDPAVLHPVRGVGGPDAVWTSKPLDAGLRARFGRLDWTATGPLELSTRSGNTAEPDETWSPWSAAIGAPADVASPAARFVQIRAAFARDPKAVLSAVSLPFVTDNLRALVTEVEVDGASPALATGIEASGGPVTRRTGTTLTLKWKVENPDKDELRYLVEYRLVGSTTWRDALAPRETLTKTTYTWDTADLPEGRYRVRVTASDELANPPDRAARHELESAVVLVDNTEPRVEGIELRGRRLRATLLDGVGPISRVEVSVAGSERWTPYF
ncbi:MAG: hypothetical protein FJ104_07570, partial [Deltaproteobacteria bacterium]|nr:hypothetical protein [Deltaproteobacteria bacterium]